MSINRRQFLSGAAAGAAAFGLPSLLRSAPTRRDKPNLIFFLPDQQRADTISCYGDGSTHAPTLNRLAARSVVFDRAYATQPVCTPSRSSVMSGTWPHQNGCVHNNIKLASRFKCFAELLDDPDYRTGYMGKWHLGDEVFAQRRFESWVSIEDLYLNYATAGRDRNKVSDYSEFLRSKGYKPDNRDHRSFTRKFASRLPYELSKPAFLQRHACDFLERNRRDPFVLFISYLEPHTPFNGPFNEAHRPDEVKLDPCTDVPLEPDTPLRYRLRAEALRDFAPTREDVRKVKRKYMGLVTEIDKSMGTILEKLSSLGLDDNTIIVHVSDHGEMMGDHQLFYKSVMFEGAAHVPYFIHLPGQTRQARVRQPVSNIDIVPTLLELLGKPPHPQCAGTSQAEWLRGGSRPAELAFLEWNSGGAPGQGGEDGELANDDTKLGSPAQVSRATRENTRAAVSPEGIKLCLRDSGEHELYDHRRDPYEMRNAYRDPAYREDILRMTKEIVAWQHRTGDRIHVA